MPAADHRFYYLENFRKVLAWLRERYEDLLAPQERSFAEQFGDLPLPSAALLVRMITRRGDVFRSSRLAYAEIGCPRAAAAALIAAGWVDGQPLLDWAEWQRLFTKAELSDLFEVPAPVRRSSKPQLMQYLQATRYAGHALSLRCAQGAVFRLTVASLCERLRILFFGNFRQDWSELVLTDLGIYRYESVAIDQHARAFRTRAEIDQFYSLFECRERLRNGAPPERVLELIPAALADCEWIEARRIRLLLQAAHRLEQAGQWAQALAAYRLTKEPRAQIRAARVLEKQGRWQEASEELLSLPPGQESEPVRQLSDRIRRRLRRRLGTDLVGRNLAVSGPPGRRSHAGGTPLPAVARAWPTFCIRIPAPVVPVAVESLAAQQLGSGEAPVFYVENGLLNSLLGLWCWEALFAPVPGAFFHPFQAAPADLLATQFCGRRASQLDACRASLQTGEYRERIRKTFRDKAGLACPFVAWDLLTPELLALALECVPPRDLGRCFERILADIPANRTGLPDLIQFFPRQRRYRLIEVKGPGDRLQDNQVRWLNFCVSNGIDATVCKVAWTDDAEAARQAEDTGDTEDTRDAQTWQPEDTPRDAENAGPSSAAAAVSL